ncbi:MAG: ferritin-like domain-containing protein [Mariprofundaceae bacterium]
MRNLRVEARDCLQVRSADEKIAAVRELMARAQGLPAGEAAELAGVDAPGRPDRPVLVPPARVPKRGAGSREGRAALMHAIVHIEFNAINLALDAIARFAGMPRAYYLDWLRIAAEEAYHFEILRAHLRHLGADYGDFPAHDGLWEMAEKTAGDVLDRMALVPRVLEARGLDVTPGIQAKLRQGGDANAATLLDIIFRDEIGHVETGTRWFRWLCGQRELDPEAAFFALLTSHFPEGLHGPWSLEARQQAGFSETELARLVGR